MIPVSEPVLRGREAEYVAECLATGWISSSGRFIEAFEDAWASYCGRRFGVAVSNGTVALQLAVASLGIGPGDEVIMPTFTIISCALAVVYAGATPVLVDADPETWCMDVEPGRGEDHDPDARDHAGPHLRPSGGHGPAHAPGGAARPCRHRGRRGGARRGIPIQPERRRRLAPMRQLRRGQLLQLLRQQARHDRRRRHGRHRRRAARPAPPFLRNLAFEPGRRFLHRELGFNFRLTNVQAAIGLAQVERIDETVARKRAIGHRYAAALSGTRGIRLQPERDWAKSVYWMNGLVLDRTTGLDARALAERLRPVGVETRPFFLGMHRQPALLERGLFGGETYPIADEIAEQGLYLPSGVGLTDDQVDAVAMATAEALR